MKLILLCRRFVMGWLAFALLSPLASHAQAINSDVASCIQQHLDAGEFAPATKLAQQLAPDLANHWLTEISRQQVSSNSAAAYETAGMIPDDLARADLLSTLSNNAPAGAAGGVSEDDFEPLIDLITGSIASDSWIDTGSGLGTISAYPAGVFVDSAGTLKKIKTDSTFSQKKFRQQAFSDSGNRQPQLPSKLRKISLTRLEKAAQLQSAQGLPLGDTLLNLAGITQIQYLFADRQTGEIIIAGPAGAWKPDLQNRNINVNTGSPVLQLDDLVVCLRNAYQNNGKFGCSISPRQKNLAATQAFLATTQLKGKRWSEGIRAALGQQDIRVFGIDQQSHAARVIVEADYRMKLIGMGLEASVPGVAHYLDRIHLNDDGSLPPLDVVRWWFTQNYDSVLADDSNSLFTFTGTGVQVLSETEMLGKDGERIHTGTSTGPTKLFAQDFTKHFDEIAQQVPVFRELKNVFDMALVASLIRQRNLAEEVDWHLTFFGPESAGRLHYSIAHSAVARQVDSVVNQRVIREKRRTSTRKHTLLGVSGGIQYDATSALSGLKIADENEIGQNSAGLSPPADESNWWWD